MPGRPPLEGPFSANFKHGTIKPSNACLKTRLPICHSCLSGFSAGTDYTQDRSAQDTSCDEAKYVLGSVAVAEETVITPGFSTIADADQQSRSLTWQDPEVYLKWWPSSSDNTLRDGLIGGFTYFMDEVDLKWLQSYNASRLDDATVPNHDVQVPSLELSEDVFELVMGFFEMVTHFAEQFSLTRNAKQGKQDAKIHMLPEFEAILSAPLNPTIFISGQAPSWLPLPELLSKVAGSMYDHWQQRKKDREGLRLIPVIERNFFKKPPFGYACFAPRPLRDELWWSSSTRSADLPPAPVPLQERSLSQLWGDHLFAVRQIRETVPAENARYAFNQFHKFCKDDVSPMVADMQNSSAPLNQGEETRKSFILEILTKDLKVVHDHEKLLSVRRVNEYLKDFAERTKKSNTTLRKSQPKQKTKSLKAKITKAQPKMGEFSLVAGRNHRIIKLGSPPMLLPPLTLQSDQGTGSGRWVIRIGPSGQNYRPLAIVYISDGQDNSAPPTPSTSSEVHSPTIVEDAKAGLDNRPVDSPHTEDILEVTGQQTTSDELRTDAMAKPAYDHHSRKKRLNSNPNPNSSTATSKERRRVSTPAALPANVSAGPSFEDKKKSLLQTPSSPPNVPSRSQRPLVAPAPVLPLAPDSAPPITFGSKVHQNASFSFAVPASKGASTPKLPSASSSLSAPASLCSDHHTTATKAPPKAPKADAKKRGEPRRPPRKRARTAINPVNDENLPNTI